MTKRNVATGFWADKGHVTITATNGPNIIVNKRDIYRLAMVCCAADPTRISRFLPKNKKFAPLPFSSFSGNKLKP